jgi:hypothetical protein
MSHGKLNSMTIATACCHSTGPTCQDIETCERSERTISIQLTLLPVDSPVRTSARRESASASTASAADYGESSPVLLASYDPVTSSWKTSQLCLDEEWAEYSGTWPRAGMMRNGTAYQRPPLVPRTYVTGCSSSHIGRPRLRLGPEETGYWPTPRAVDNGQIETNRRDPRNKTTAPTLSEAVRMWPTPNASVANLGEKPNTWLARAARLKAKHRNGNGAGMPLSIAVQLWPTPQAHDALRGYSHRIGRHGTTHGDRNLNDWAVASMEKVSGLLNPQWVAWLMGFPLDWCDLLCKPTATPSSPKSPSTSDG